jgi:Leucine-rich repeat (LRR) protein
MNLKLLVLPMAKDQAFLEVNAINARKITDKELREINSIKEQLVSLKLANTQVTDEFVMDLADYPRLINLQLGHTKITDKSLEALQNSPRLETLNLYATAVTDAGILKLAQIKTLRNLYVWQSKVSPAGIAQLKKLRPKLHIDNGTKVVFPIKQDSLIL